MKIYKYVPDIRGDVTVPSEHRLLSIQLQNDVPTVWVAVEPAAKTTTVLRVWSKFTGESVTADELRFYHSTVIDAIGLVWHLFVKDTDETLVVNYMGVRNG